MPGILFVCAANRARSALAELTARALLDQSPGGHEITVGSAGTWTPGNEPMWPPAAAEARRLGLSPEGFLSRPITTDLIEKTDIVLAATRALRDEVVRAHPEALNRAFTWREVAWSLEAVSPQWDGTPMYDRPAALPDFITHYRGRVPAVRGIDLDVEDPAGRSPAVMTKASQLTVAAVTVIVAALTQP